jgi:hypothetical protein
LIQEAQNERDCLNKVAKQVKVWAADREAAAVDRKQSFYTDWPRG